jgi:hypothetical protein
MTERKPSGMSFRTWIDQQIEEAAERGEFDDLPGAGKPLARRDEPDDGQSWIREYVKREGVSAEVFLPEPLKLRKETERLALTVHELPGEQAVRDAVADLNQRITKWRRIPVGPPIFVPLADEEAMLARWREARPPPPAAPARPEEAGPGPRRWWRRRP